MIGPFTYAGWLAAFAVVALWIAMFRFGHRRQWLFGFSFTVPFVLLLGWLDWRTAGPPMWEDPYGPMLFMIVMGPIAFGWLLFLIALLARRTQKQA